MPEWINVGKMVTSTTTLWGSHDRWGHWGLGTVTCVKVPELVRDRARVPPLVYHSRAQALDWTVVILSQPMAGWLDRWMDGWSGGMEGWVITCSLSFLTPKRLNPWPTPSCLLSQLCNPQTVAESKKVCRNQRATVFSDVPGETRPVQ